MANSLYTKARVAFLSGQIDLLNDTIKVALVGETYVPDLAADEFWSDAEADVIGTPETIANVVINEVAGDAVVDADDVTFSSVTGDTVKYMLFYKDTGVAATSPLILLMDTASGLPLLPTGVDVPVLWSTSGIFSWLGC